MTRPRLLSGLPALRLWLGLALLRAAAWVLGVGGFEFVFGEGEK